MYYVIVAAFHNHNPFGTSRTNEKSYKPLIGAILSEWQEPKSKDELYTLLRDELSDWLGAGYVSSNSMVSARLQQVAAEVYGKLPTLRQQISTDDGDKESATHREYAMMYYQALKIIHRQDPIYIGYFPDEYIPEVETILPRLKEANSPDHLFHIVEEEFRKWFGGTNTRPDAEQKYKEISKQLWLLWQRSTLGTELDNYLTVT